MTQVASEQPKLVNRWIIVIAAVVVQFALGALYSYSFIKTPMKNFVGPGTDDTTALLPFAFALLFFAILMIPAGRLQDKKGPRLVASIGSIVLLIGVFLAGLVASVPSGGSIWGMVVTFGIIGGGGIGLVYVCPIACATKWFPDKVGLVNGLAVAGFGAGSILFNFIYKFMVPLIGLSGTLILASIIMGGMAFGGGIVLRNPPVGYKPAGWEPPAPKPGTVVVENWETKEMVKTPTFYMLWGMYVCSAICGLMVIGNFAPYGSDIPRYSTPPDIPLSDFMMLISVYIAAIAGVCNAGGRIVWGKLSDKIGRVKTMAILFVVQAASMMLFAIPSIYTWAIFGNLVYFCFGGNLSLFPATTRTYFGAKYMGLNYALVFTAYGVAGILGALLANPAINVFGTLLNSKLAGYSVYFVIFGCTSLVSLVLSFFTKAPERKK
ncbi:MAG: OFA family MFS transporter [Candidatus Sigynarchaeota archaeon]